MSIKPSMNDLKPKMRKVPRGRVEASPLIKPTDLVVPPPLKRLKPQSSERFTRPLVTIFIGIALVMVFVLAWIMYTNIKAS